MKDVDQYKCKGSVLDRKEWLRSSLLDFDNDIYFSFIPNIKYKLKEFIPYK